MAESSSLHMSIAKEFLHGAQLTFEKDLHRVAAANAYYAMFWSAQAALRHVGTVREQWSHGGLQNAFGLEIIKKRRMLTPSLGEWINRAYTLRRLAHYSPTGVGIKEVRRLLQHTQDFVTRIQEVIGK